MVITIWQKRKLEKKMTHLKIDAALKQIRNLLKEEAKTPTAATIVKPYQ